MDALGFELYVTAMATFLADPDTHPPLTLSIEGEWGAGKSSFLAQLRAALEIRGHKVIEFNAWRHDKDEALWAAFAEEFYEKVQPPGAWKKWLARVALGWERLDKGAAAVDLAKIVLFSGAVAFGAAEALALAGRTATPDPVWVAKLKLTGSIVVSLATAGLASDAVRHVREIVGNPFKVDLARHIESVDYKSKRSFLSRFQADFQRMTKSHLSRRDRVFVFIDDLDRCEVPKAAELLQALQVMLPDDSKIITLLGIDRERVAAGIAMRNEKLLPLVAMPDADKAAKVPYDAQRALEFGYSFLEKFIQLPFRLPRPGRVELERYLEKLLGPEAPAVETKHAPAESIKAAELPGAFETRRVTQALASGWGAPDGDLFAGGKQNVARAPRTAQTEAALKAVKRDSLVVREVLRMVAPALDDNPRRLVQFLNSFRLQAHIAGEMGLFDSRSDGKQPLTLQRLGKLTAIALVWPKMLQEIAQIPDFLSRLQVSAIGTDIADSYSKRLEELPKLRSLLRHGVVSEGIVVERIPPLDAYRLDNIDVTQLLRTSARSRPARAEQKRP